jgi:hypothetical protein
VGTLQVEKLQVRKCGSCKASMLRERKKLEIGFQRAKTGTERAAGASSRGAAKLSRSSQSTGACMAGMRVGGLSGKSE